MFWITLFLIFNIWIHCEGQTTGNRTTNELVQSCKCMRYWDCLSEGGLVYSSCGLVNICCLFGKLRDKDEFFYKQLIKKKLSDPIKPKKKAAKRNKKIVKERSKELTEILNNQLTNQSRPSRRKPNNNQNNQNSLFCGRSGEQGELYHYKWHADILEKKQNLYICGGSLIRNDYILTASHCFLNARNASTLKVRLGDYDISRDDELDLPYEEVSVKRIITHPKFSRDTLDNDIALLQLDKPVKTNAIIEKICLPTAEMLKSISTNLEKLNCFVIGHGKLNETSKNYSLTVKQIKVPIWTKKKCESALPRLFGPNIPSMNSILCAGSINQDACIGDGGSSLTCSFDNSRFYQFGVVSFGVGCGRSSIPGVYSSLIGNLEFIQKTINRSIDRN